MAETMTEETHQHIVKVLKERKYIVITHVPDIDDLKNKFLPMVRNNKDVDVEKYGIGAGTTGPQSFGLYKGYLPGGVCYFRASPLYDDEIKERFKDATDLGFTADNFPSHLDPVRWPENVENYREVSVAYAKCIERLGNQILGVVDTQMKRLYPDNDKILSLKT